MMIPSADVTNVATRPVDITAIEAVLITILLTMMFTCLRDILRKF